MKRIQLLTMKNGNVVLDKYAKSGVTVEEVCEIAEYEVCDGYADYARVTVDGEIYMEMEGEI